MSADDRTTLDDLMRSIRGVVFDKDGTLADLDARWVPFFRSGIDALGVSCDDPALVSALDEELGVADTFLVPDGPAAVETPARIIARIVAVLTSHGHDLRHVDAVIAAAESGETFGPLVPIGDVVGTLTALDRHGVLLGVATSDGRANTIDELAALEIDELIQAIRCGDDEGPVKPDPSVLIGIAVEWNLEPSHLLFVGDSREDLETARDAGAHFVARCHPDRVPAWTRAADAVVADVGRLVGHR